MSLNVYIIKAIKKHDSEVLSLTQVCLENKLFFNLTGRLSNANLHTEHIDAMNINLNSRSVLISNTGTKLKIK